jgi:hypothetical protein
VIRHYTDTVESSRYVARVVVVVVTKREGKATVARNHEKFINKGKENLFALLGS